MTNETARLLSDLRYTVREGREFALIAAAPRQPADVRDAAAEMVTICTKAAQAYRDALRARGVELTD